jgi:hypothetical protein
MTSTVDVAAADPFSCLPELRPHAAIICIRVPRELSRSDSLCGMGTPVALWSFVKELSQDIGRNSGVEPHLLTPKQKELG